MILLCTLLHLCVLFFIDFRMLDEHIFRWKIVHEVTLLILLVEDRGNITGKCKKRVAAYSEFQEILFEGKIQI